MRHTFVRGQRNTIYCFKSILFIYLLRIRIIFKNQEAQSIIPFIAGFVFRKRNELAADASISKMRVNTKRVKKITIPDRCGIKMSKVVNSVMG